MNNYILDQQREAKLIADVIDSVKKESEVITDHLAEIINSDSNEKYVFVKLDKDMEVSTVNEMGVIPVTSLGLVNNEVKLKKYTAISVVSMESMKFESVNLDSELKKGFSRALAKAISSDYLTLVQDGATEVPKTDNMAIDLSDAMSILETSDRNATNVILPKSDKGVIRKGMETNADTQINLKDAFGVPVTFMNTENAVVVDNKTIKVILGDVKIDVVDTGVVEDNGVTTNLFQQGAVAYKVTMFGAVCKFDKQAVIK